MERKNSLRTFYEILELNKTATLDEIKCSYKKLALLYHPDRNADNPEDYHEKFIEINEAYQMLSNPIKRTWYDENMKSFHSPCVIDEKEFEIPAEYFQFSRHQKFDDSEDGFYTVYRELFDRITKQEIKFYDDPEDFHYPSFGDSKSTAESVKRFYDQWQSFCTAIEYVGQYKYDCREAPNRKIFRLMQKENHKIRDKARKLRNQTIQNLVKNLRKKDERFQQIRIASENRKKTNQNKSEQNRRGQIRKNLENLCDYREPEWASMKMLEKDLEDLEAQHMREEKKNFDCYDDDEDDDEEEEEEKNDQSLKKSSNNIESMEENDSEDDLVYRCATCKKIFKNLNAYTNHEKSKKHLKNIKSSW